MIQSDDNEFHIKTKVEVKVQVKIFLIKN
jgi:hypothetical protein